MTKSISNLAREEEDIVELRDDRSCGLAPFETGKDDPFYIDCYAHDIGYEEGGNKLQQEVTDQQFYDSIWTKARKNIWLVPRAFIYTFMVKLVGFRIWKTK